MLILFFSGALEIRPGTGRGGCNYALAYALACRGIDCDALVS